MQIISNGCRKAQTWGNHARAKETPYAIHEKKEIFMRFVLYCLCNLQKRYKTWCDFFIF